MTLAACSSRLPTTRDGPSLGANCRGTGGGVQTPAPATTSTSTTGAFLCASDRYPVPRRGRDARARRLNDVERRRKGVASGDGAAEAQADRDRPADRATPGAQS